MYLFNFQNNVTVEMSLTFSTFVRSYVTQTHGHTDNTYITYSTYKYIHTYVYSDFVTLYFDSSCCFTDN